MKRRLFLKTTGIAAAGINTLLSIKKAYAAEKPNIIIIFCDDHITESIRDGALVPNIKSLAKDGIFFSRSYSPSAACTPARYTCLTGRYAGRCRGRFLQSGITKEGQTWVHWNSTTDESDMIGAGVLKNAGYKTGIVGKLGCFTLKEAKDFRLDPKMSPDDPKKKVIFRKQQEAMARGVKKYGFDFGGAMTFSNMKPGQEHNPEYQTKKCLEFIDSCKGQKPFYLHFVPHLMHMPSPIKCLKNADVRNVYGVMVDKFKPVQPSRKSVLKRVKDAGLDEDLAPATWFDDSVGALLKRLKELKIVNNTLIIFTQDNGHHGGKVSNYEGGVNVLGCWMRWPDGIVKPGRVNDSLIANIDFIPTAFDACGVKPPEDYIIDGISLMPILKNKQKKLRDSLMCEIGHTRAVVTEKWKYIAFRVPKSHQLDNEKQATYLKLAATDPSMDKQGRVTHVHRSIGGCNTERTEALRKYPNFFDTDQLYDLGKDTEEQLNLAGNPEYRSVLNKMQELLKKHIKTAPGIFAGFKTYNDMDPEEREKWKKLASGNTWKGAGINTKPPGKPRKKKIKKK